MREDSALVKLYQIPFSHNSVKVRRVLALKGLDYERESVNPAIRRKLKRISGQELTPVLVDGERVVSDSTAIALYLDEVYPANPLLPEQPDQRAECLLLEDWADEAFMALTRRLAYWTLLTSGGELGDLFFPRYPKPVRRLSSPFGAAVIRRRFRLSARQAEKDEAEARRVAKLATDRLAGRDYLVGDRLSLADVALAAMSAPLQFTPPAIGEEPAVAELLSWDRTILEDEFTPPQVRSTLET
jgi:glutathione S-transferase